MPRASEPPAPPFSFPRLFLTLVLAAPAATLLSLIVHDFYEPAPSKAIEALVEETKTEKKAVSVSTAPSSGALSDKQLKAIVAALARQVRALEKMANKKPATIKVTSPAATSSSKVVVVKVPSRERFDLTYEIQRILELSGIDLDDPVTNRQPFGKVKSRSVMKEVIRSLTAIIAAARDHAEVTEYLQSNALRAKGHATNRLKKLRTP